MISFFIHVLSVYICVSVCHMCVGVFEGGKRVADFLELELQAVGGCLIWVLGTEL